MAKLFRLEAVFAKHGDALLLHYGPAANPQRILIDGGPRGVYRKYLRPRLEQLKEDDGLDRDQPLPLKLVMVSHIDDDHIAGILDLFRETLEAKERRQPLPYAIGAFWHNSFDDLLGNDPAQIVSRMAATVASRDPAGLPVPRMSRESQAVVASTAQGRQLRNAARKLQVEVNPPFPDLIMAPAKKIDLDHGLVLTVIGPSRERIAEYQQQWDEDLEKILQKEQDAAEAAAFADDSPFNLASVCVLARMSRKTMLLTGDARGDYILEGLQRARLLRKTRPLHVDLLKVPHHGSSRNVEDVFFERVIADHYVISGDGQYGNPDLETLEMIQRARGGDPYTIHFTFTADAHASEQNATRKKALEKIDRWAAQRPANCGVAYRGGGEHTDSICVDLLSPLAGA